MESWCCLGYPEIQFEWQFVVCEINFSGGGGGAATLNCINILVVCVCLCDSPSPEISTHINIQCVGNPPHTHRLISPTGLACKQPAESVKESSPLPSRTNESVIYGRHTQIPKKSERQMLNGAHSSWPHDTKTESYCARGWVGGCMDGQTNRRTGGITSDRRSVLMREN